MCQYWRLSCQKCSSWELKFFLIWMCTTSTAWLNGCVEALESCERCEPCDSCEERRGGGCEGGRDTGWEEGEEGKRAGLLSLWASWLFPSSILSSCLISWILDFPSWNNFLCAALVIPHLFSSYNDDVMMMSQWCHNQHSNHLYTFYIANFKKIKNLHHFEFCVYWLHVTCNIKTFTYNAMGNWVNGLVAQIK